MREAAIRRLLFRFFLIVAGALLLMVFAETFGWISIRTMAFVDAAFSLAGFGFMTISLRRINADFPQIEPTQATFSDPVQRKKLTRSIKSFQILLAIWVVSLVFGLFNVRGQPLSGTIIGITVNLCLTGATLHVIRDQKRKLGRFRTDPIAPSTTNNIESEGR